MKKLSANLEKVGIRSSYQRLKILGYLQAQRTHPTVDMIYKELSKEIPTLSKTTVYNTLKLFVCNDIVQELTIEEKEVRYDADTTQHAHFKCTDCGSVYDLALKSTIFDKEAIEGHKVLECHIYLKGLCKYCLKRAVNENLLEL